MKTTYAPFDVADYLNNDEVITEYLTAAASDPNTEVFIAAQRSLFIFGYFHCVTLVFFRVPLWLNVLCSPTKELKVNHQDTQR